MTINLKINFETYIGLDPGIFYLSDNRLDMCVYVCFESYFLSFFLRGYPVDDAVTVVIQYMIGKHVIKKDGKTKINLSPALWTIRIDGSF